MITPAYAPTATERVLPRLALDFTTGVLDPRVTVTRALNTATCFDSTGAMVLVNANLPRFDYNPTTLAAKGLLIEESRSNTFINSVFAGASAGTPGTFPTSWSVNFNSGAITNVSPSVYSSANKLTLSCTAQRVVFSQSFTFVANTTYAFSMYVNVISGTIAFTDLLTINGPPSGATLTYFIDGVSSSAFATISTGFKRLTIICAVASTGSTSSIRVGLGNNGNATGSAAIELPQAETGAFATSYIPTTTTSLTRNTDVVSMTGTNFSSWYNATQGSFMAEYSSNAAAISGISKAVLAVNDTTLSNRLYMNVSATAIPFLFVNTGGVSQANISTGVTLTNGTTTKTVMSYKLDDFAAATNGNAAGTDTSGTVPTVTALNIGHLLGFSSLFGHMKKLSYWPQRLINAENSSFSK